MGVEMFHKLARKHLLMLKNITTAIPGYSNRSDSIVLNLNLNNFSSDKYRFYPESNVDSVLLKYLSCLDGFGHIKLNKTSLKIEDLFLSSGSAGAIDLIIRGFCEPNQDSVIIASPAFPYYSHRAHLENVSVIDIPLLGENYDTLNIDKILAHEAKILFLCSPNNPVGTLLKQSEVETILKNFAGIVIMDEAYIEWSNYPSYVEWIKKYDNLIVLRSFSKFWGLAGVRAGMVIASTPIVSVLHLIKTMFSFPQSSFDLLINKINEIGIHLEYKNKMIKERNKLCEFLANMDLVVRVFPSEANYLLVQFHDEKAVFQTLLDSNIFVANSSMQVPHSLRISIGLEEEMDSLKIALKKCCVANLA
ncbi:MAG: hypothetical protein A2Y28_00015 [Chlamydiae bacterium GWC2_50_10]|nr:MAG: hypothetical protein A2Y28_00015 [Chlamydiae bacterium GWC2_50_10]